jgi:hypothetical protein
LEEPSDPVPEDEERLQAELAILGGIEEHLQRHKEYRDEHHPNCQHLFFWMAADVQIPRGGVRNVLGTPIKDFRESWANAVKKAHKANPNVMPELLFHDLRRSGVRVMVQEAGLPESQAMLISGHKTRAMLERYNVISLKNIQTAGAKLDACSRSKGS